MKFDSNLTNNICVDFDMIYEINFGVFKFVQNHLANNEIFNNLICTKTTDKVFKYRLMNERYGNVLELLVEKEHIGDILDLYNEICDEYMELILDKYASKTNMFRLLHAHSLNNEISINVSYSNDKQLEMIKRDLPFANVIKEDEINIEMHDTFYIYDELLLNGLNLNKKNIYLPNYLNYTEADCKNLQEGSKIQQMEQNDNRIMIVDLYNVVELLS